jgi:RNA polymerase sigma-70 factor (ECF subfamily)
MRPLTPAEEREWIRRLKDRDERAFKRLVLEYQDRIFNLCMRMLGHREEAMDLSQEVFQKVFEAIPTFRGESKVGTWVYQIAINRCRNRLKYLSRRHRDRHAPLSDVAEGRLSSSHGSSHGLSSQIPQPDRVAEGNETQDFLIKAIGGLEEEQREILVLRDIQGLSYAEIGEVTGLAEGTVKSRLFRARRTLTAEFVRWSQGESEEPSNAE